MLIAAAADASLQRYRKDDAADAASPSLAGHRRCSSLHPWAELLTEERGGT